MKPREEEADQTPKEDRRWKTGGEGETWGGRMVLSQGTEARYHKRVVRIHSANDSQIDRRDNKGGSIRKGWYSFGEGNIFSILP